MNPLKSIARFILKKELNANERLIFRLRSYARKHLPIISPDGTDQTYNIQYHVDVNDSFTLKGGNCSIRDSIEIDKDSIIMGEK